MLTASGKIHLAGEDRVAMCDTGSAGIGVRVRLKMVMGETVVNFVFDREIKQREMLVVVLGMTQQVTLRWETRFIYRVYRDIFV